MCLGFDMGEQLQGGLWLAVLLNLTNRLRKAESGGGGMALKLVSGSF